jgi:hypothetical protein
MSLEGWELPPSGKRGRAVAVARNSGELYHGALHQPIAIA